MRKKENCDFEMNRNYRRQIIHANLFGIVMLVWKRIEVGRVVGVDMETAGLKGFEIEEIRIRVPWGEIAAKCWNSPESEPVLVVHGLCENAGSFDRILPLLSKRFYYVVVDLPGHGWSSPFPRGLPLDFMHYVGQLLRVVDHFQWEKMSLMGHSFGAHLLEFFAATYSNRVVKLILIDAVSPTPVPSDVFLLFHRNRAKEAMMLESEDRKRPKFYAYEDALSRITDGRLSKLKPEAARPLLDRCLVKEGSGYFFATDSRMKTEIKPPMDENVLFDQIKKIKCPVLVILAENSEYFDLFDFSDFYSLVLGILKRSHVGSTIVRVPGNHCVHNNEPQLIAPIVNRFLIQEMSRF